MPHRLRKIRKKRGSRTHGDSTGEEGREEDTGKQDSININGHM
jgi:hypothetical protein